MQRIGIIGAGRFGETLAQGLAERGCEVLLMDERPETVQRLSASVTKAVIGNATDRAALEEAGFGECDAVAVTIAENMEGSILATLTLKEMGVPYIVARASTESHGKVLERVGADKVVYPARDMALRLVRSLAASAVRDYVEVFDGVSVMEITAPAPWVGKSLSEARIRNQYGLTILAVRRPGEKPGETETLVPAADDVVQEGDVLVVFGADDRLTRLQKDLA